MFSYLNGKILPLNKININPYDLGLLRGYAVFDVMRTRGGKPFLFEEHWRRLCNSAKETGLSVPITREVFKKNVEELLRRNKFPESTVRTVLTGGVSENGFTYTSGKETLCILVEKFQPLSQEIFEKGVKVAVVRYARDLSRAKTTNYLMAIKSQGLKKKRKAFEILYIDHQGRVLETATSNFFIVKNGKVITSAEGILPGITRKTVIALAKKSGLKVEEREIKEEEVYHADEAFLTATNKDIVPVVKVDNKKIGKGRVGDVTKLLLDAFIKYAKEY